MSLCKVCDALNLDEKETNLGEYNEILTRANNGCGGCRFFCDILLTSASWKDRISQLPGHIVFLSRKRLDVRKPEDINSRRWSCDDLLFDYCTSEDCTSPKDDETDSRIAIPPSITDESCLKKVQSWISGCSAHQDCPKSKKVPLPMRIIEVSSEPFVAPKLVSGKGKEGSSYLVLSYCSGDNPPNLNCLTLGQDLDLNSLPKTFADAIIITRKLGFQYIWIGSLCTEQSHNGQAQIYSNMAHIFGQAALMISATRSKDLNSGILYDRVVHYSPGLGSNKDRFFRRRNLRWIDELEYSPLARRGWAIQERIFAPRILHFTSQQMIWECPSGYNFEASNIPDKITGSGQIRQRYKKSYVQPYITKGLSNSSKSDKTVDEENERTISYVHRLEAWHQSLDLFTHGTFSNPLDKLLAIASLAQILNNGQLGDYLAGIWSRNIGYGLAWSRVNQVLTPSPSYRAPSWSWASVDNPTSSMMLFWSPTILDSQAENPAWIERYGLKLLSHQIIPRDLANPNPYGSPAPGSNIILEGSTIGFSKLSKWFEASDPRIFHPTFVLDQSWGFDCPCCRNQHDASEHEAEAGKFKKDHHICLIIQGDGWIDQESAVEMLVLRRISTLRDAPPDAEEGIARLSVTDEDIEGYERVGILRLQMDISYRLIWENKEKTFDRVTLREAFDGMGWERKVVKLF